MKKLLICLLAIAMMFSMVACNSNTTTEGTTTEGTKTEGNKTEDSDETIELVFWGHQEDTWNNSYEAIGEAFTAENPNITVKFEFFPYDEFESKIQTSLIAKSGGADMYEMWGGWGLDFASTGALAAIPEDMMFVTEGMYPSTTGALEYDSKLYGLPMEFNIEMGAMLVNLNILNENGLEIPTTWDEMIASAKEATVIDGEEYQVKGFDFVNWDSVSYVMTSIILSNGGQYQNEDGTFNFTSDEAKEAFTVLSDLVLEEQVTDLIGLTGGGDLEGFQQLYAGQALFVPRGPWCITEGIDSFELVYDEDFTYAPMPWYNPDSPAFAAETGWALAVNGASENQEAAFKFLEYMYSDEVLLNHNIACGMIPPKASVAKSAEYLEAMPHVEPLVNALDNSQYIGHFNTDVFKETINNVFVDYCQGIYGSVDEALQALEDTLNAELS